MMETNLSFNWDIHRACNYNCPYCWFHNTWDRIKDGNVYLPPEELLAPWRKIYEKHGTVSIGICGGEPFLYPGFNEFLPALTQMHRCMVITNLSQEVAPVLEACRRDHLTVNPSFHPLSTDAATFIRKARLLQDAGVTTCITCVSWPPLIPRLPGYAAEFERNGLHLTLQSFFGEYNGKRYPDSYTDEEKELINPNLGSRGGARFLTESFSPKGKLCNAGRTYGIIQPDGLVRRCGGSDEKPVGNIFDPSFQMLETPLPCTADVCKCNEWAFLLVERKQKKD